MVYSCIGNYAKNPYYIEKVGIHIYSAEELCYYLFQNAFLLDHTVMKPELCDFVENELGLTELSGKLSGLLRAGGSLSAFVSTILEDMHYCTREELKNIEQALRDNEKLGPGQKRKVRGDYFTRNGKYLPALKEYQEALTAQGADDEFRSAVCHNMGVVYAKMFYFDKAGEMMKKAYGFVQEEDLYLKWLACSRLAGSRDEYLDFILKEKADQDLYLKLEEKLQKIFSEDEEKKDKNYLAFKKVLSMKEEGRIALYYEGVDGILAEWKREYRKNMEE